MTNSGFITAAALAFAATLALATAVHAADVPCPTVSQPGKAARCGG